MAALTTEIAIMASTKHNNCVRYFESYNYQQSLCAPLPLTYTPFFGFKCGGLG
jgi:hypothetical protein